MSLIYRNNLKNREFDKEAPQNFCLERATIAEGQGASENKNCEGKPTSSKTDSSRCFGINKKWMVWYQLSQQAKPVTLLALLECLGSGYVERSVRRWLSEMVEENLVEKSGQKRAICYQCVASPFSSFPGLLRESNEERSISHYFGDASAELIAQVRRPLYMRLPVAYADEWVDAYQPNQTFYIPEIVRKELHQMGKSSSLQEPKGSYARRIFNRLLIDLSYNSSRLEGNTYSRLETEKLLLDGQSAEGKLDEEKIMILNHKEAIRYLVDHSAHLEVDSSTFCTLHYLLSDGLVEPSCVGKVRDHAVRIGGSTYCPFENAKQLQMRLNRLAQKAACIEDIYEQSLFLLVHVSYLQAFADVNKRTARLSCNIPLIRNDVVPLSFNDVNREDYISAMIAVYELQQVGPMLDLYLFSYTRTCAQYESEIKAMGIDEVRVRCRAERRGLVRHILLKKLAGDLLTDYVHSEASKRIQETDRHAFIEDVFEDLREICPSRLAGLGVTTEELAAWASAIQNMKLPAL